MKITDADVLGIARHAHEANRLFCESNGDDTQKPWAQCETWQRNSAVKGVYRIIENRSITPEEIHAAWVEAMVADGWVHGEKKEPAKLTHPCIVPYNKLPEFQRTKDVVFTMLVKSALYILEN